MDQRLFQFPTRGRRWIKANKWSRFTKYQIKCIVLCKAILLFLCSAHRSNVLNRLQLVTWSLAKDCQLWKNNPHYFYFLFSNLILKVTQTRFNSFSARATGTQTTAKTPLPSTSPGSLSASSPLSSPTRAQRCCSTWCCTGTPISERTSSPRQISIWSAQLKI